MPILQFPHQEPIKPVHCIICSRQINPTQATAGLTDAKDRQAFACNKHCREPSRLITGWADFAFKERLTLTRINREIRNHINQLKGGEEDEWAVY